ncbi:MAG: hypothetical protein R2813_01355 [Flavobacteriales bacterium]
MNTRLIWDRFGLLISPFRKQIVRIYVYAVFSGLVYLALPLGIQVIITYLQTGAFTYSWIILALLVLVAIIFSGILTIYQMRVSENIEQELFVNNSFDFHTLLGDLTGKQLPGVDLKEKMNRFFDVVLLQKKISKLLLDIPAATVQIVFGITLLCFYHPIFLFVIFILLLLSYLVYKISWRIGLKTSLEESDWKYKVADHLEKKASSAAELTSIEPSKKEFDGLVYNYLNRRESHFKTLVFQFSWMIGMKVIVAAILLFLGGWLVISNTLNIGQFVAAEVVILLMLNSIEKLIINMESIYDVLTSNEKIQAVFQLRETLNK